jgi:hypothetical protein
MSNIKLSLYGYVFRARAAGLDLDATIANFTAFADETVIVTLAGQDDDTVSRLLAYEDYLSHKLKVLVVDMDIDKNNRFDGDLKTIAMQACTHPVRIIADCDERFIARQRPRWDDLACQLLANPQLDGWMIPVLDLYSHADYIRLNEAIGLKFRMHKASVVRRGVPAFAEKGGGLIDTSRSDTTEPCLVDGSLANFTCPYDRSLLHPSTCRLLADDCYVIHQGFIDLQKRAELGRTFWRKHWELRSGREERVATRIEELVDVPVVKHGLPLT